jgi:hypothetical protein
MVLLSGTGSADVGIQAPMDHNDIRIVLHNTKELYRTIQNKRHGMMISGVVLLHDNATSA